MSTAQQYEYVPLLDPANSIRLLKLLPISDDDERTLRAELITCRRDEAPSFKPVSYTWGQQDPTSTLFLRDFDANCNCHASNSETQPSPVMAIQSVSDTDTLSILTSRPTPPDSSAPECRHTAWRRFPIRPNLEALLRRFRRLPGPKIFWVDAICIDQGNNHEKGHQVRNMDKIYRDKNLLIWLGEPTENTDMAIDLLDALANCYTTDGLDTPKRIQARKDFNTQVQDVPSLKAFVEVIRRPWFTRRWIVQEFVLSNHKHAFIGNREFCFQPVVTLCHHLKKLPGLAPGGQEKTTCRDAGHASGAKMHGFPAPILDPVESLDRLFNVFSAVMKADTASLTLERLLDNFASFESVDPRDGIYAFLSMASDVGEKDWIPDYSENNTASKVYEKATFHIMSRANCLDIICRRVHDFRFGRSVSHRSSWIPWFGPQRIEFWPGHFHTIHGYNTKSLATFGQRLVTLRDGQAGHHFSTKCECHDCGKLHVVHRQHGCDGCKERIQGTGYKCLDCPDFDYCYRCIGLSTSDHDTSHRFEIFNRAVYSASGSSAPYNNPYSSPSWLDPCPCGPSCNHATTLGVPGFLVDSVQGVEKGGSVEYKARGRTLCMPVDEWQNLPGMKEVGGLDIDGQLGDKFFRAFTGNRRVVDGRICHIPDGHMRCFKQGFTTESRPVSEDTSDLVGSAAFMLSNMRRFVTTERSLGFVPAMTQVGDRIAILIGCSVPVVIRPFPGYEEPKWWLVGECYIDGLMEGEYMETARERRLSPELITLI